MRTIRNNVFETNSSSTHSITICSKSDFDAWKNGERFFYRENEELVTLEEKEKILKERYIRSVADYNDGTYTYNGVSATYSDIDEKILTPENLAAITQEMLDEFMEDNWDSYECPMTYEEYGEYLEYEQYEVTHKTPNGDEIVAFGYYGNDY